MRRRLLAVLTLAILLPSVSVLLAAGIGIFQHQRAIQAVARTYVQDLAESTASRVEMGWGLTESLLSAKPPSRFWGNRLFSQDVGVPGWIAVLDSQGRVVMSTPGAQILSELWRPQMPIGRAVEAENRAGEAFTVAVYPAGDTGLFVMAAVSWKDLLGPMLHFGLLLPILVGLVGLAGLVGVYALWKAVIFPLKSLEAEVSSLEWGKDLPEPRDEAAVAEIGKLREEFFHLAQTAIDRSALWKRYALDLVRVQEDERARLARDLHDGPLQDVTAMIQRARLFAASGATEPGKSVHLGLLEESAQAAVKEIRSLCDELSPPWLELGLAGALTELVERLSRHLGVKIQVEADSGVGENLSKERTLALFRVAQEALHNSARHSGAPEVQVRLYREGGELILELEDEGSGFEVPEDLARLRILGHRGLANMEERMALVGGELAVDSTRGRGTRVRARVPLE
ncbi:MAG: sensor histidine kinase [Synergistales bacterium]